jgi:hypothetical protein
MNSGITSLLLGPWPSLSQALGAQTDEYTCPRFRNTDVDQAYDPDRQDEALVDQGIELIAPHKRERK